MDKVKTILVFALTFFLLANCSIVNKIKEKISSKKESTKEQTKEEDKEETVNKNSQNDLNFYNKYIDVQNKVQQSGEKLYKDYKSDIPNPKSITKNSFIMAVSMSFSVSELERTIKELKRSLYDGGELSKLEADNREMQRAVEADFKELLNVLEIYHETGDKVYKYYSSQEWKNNTSLAVQYDDDMKKVYDDYKSAMDKFSSSLKQYKPVKNRIDISTIKNPNERSRAVLLNAYENTLVKAEEFYEDFQKIKFGDDMKNIKDRTSDLKATLEKENDNINSSEFTEQTKYLKYSWEDYFYKQSQTFIDESYKFINNPGSKEADFNNNYDNVVIYYNNMITAYNTSINVLNSMTFY